MAANGTGRAKPKRRKLTLKSIQAFRYEGVLAGNGKWTRDVRWDTEVRGLGLRILPSMSADGKHEKRFVLFFRAQGRQRLMTLGRFGTITLDQARRAARKQLAAVGEGADPLGDRNRDRAAGTVAELCAEYVERHAKPRKKTWTKDLRYIERFIVPRWGTMKAKAVTPDEVESLHQRIGRDTPYQANRVIEVVKAIFGYGLRHGYLSRGDSNPAVGVVPYREVSRKRRLDFESELPQVLIAIDQEPDVFIRAYFWALFLIGCRKSELREAKWDQVSWEASTLTFPETKSGEPQVAELTPQVLELLRALYEYGDDRTLSNPYVFAGHRQGQPLKNVDRAWGRIVHRAGLKDVRVHDVRRSVGSWLADEGHDLHLISRVLHHASTETTKTYARLSPKVQRQAMAAQNKRVAAVAGRTSLAEVVDISHARKKVAG